MSLPSHNSVPSNAEKDTVFARLNWLYSDQPCETDLDAKFCQQKLDMLTRPFESFMQSPSESVKEAVRIVILSHISLACMEEFLGTLSGRDRGRHPELERIKNSMTPEIRESSLYIDTAFQSYAAERGRSVSTRDTHVKAGKILFKMARRKEESKESFYDYHLQRTDLTDERVLKAYRDFVQHCQASNTIVQPQQTTPSATTGFGTGDAHVYPPVSPESGYVNMASLANPVFGLEDFDLDPFNYTGPSAGRTESFGNVPYGQTNVWSPNMLAFGPGTALPEGQFFQGQFPEDNEFEDWQ